MLARTPLQRNDRTFEKNSQLAAGIVPHSGCSTNVCAHCACVAADAWVAYGYPRTNAPGSMRRLFADLTHTHPARLGKSPAEYARYARSRVDIVQSLYMAAAVSPYSVCPFRIGRVVASHSAEP